MTIKRTFMKLHPELAAEWSEKNSPFYPEDEKRASHQLRWWKCSVCGGEWQAETIVRAMGKGNCPYCNHRKLMKGYNDLATQRPQLAAEWDHEKNGDLKPDDVFRTSGLRVWWKCSKGHEWKESIYMRSQGNTCPRCAIEDTVKGVNDLQTLYPEVAAQWSEKNPTLRPDSVQPSYSRFLWWKCPECGSDFQKTIKGMITQETPCPYCSGRRIREGFNDLATTDPELAKEWDTKLNYDIVPEHYGRYSKKYVRWRCSKCGNEWGSTIIERVSGKKTCPYCAGKQTPVEAEPVSEEDIPDTRSSKPSEYHHGSGNARDLKELPLWEKYALSMREAASYFSLSHERLRQIVKEDMDAGYLEWYSGRPYFIRKKFEEYLNSMKQLKGEKE